MLTAMAALKCLCVGLLVFAVPVLSDNPTVIIQSTDPPIDPIEGVIIQQKGKDVQITCVVLNQPSKSEVQWTVQNYRQKGSSTVQIATATRSYDAFKWAIDTPTSTSWRLRVQNAQVSSEGIYSCKVEVISQITVKDTVEVRIVQKPEIADLMTSTDMHFDSDEQATLECYATGHPTPVIQWTRLAGELLPTGGAALQSNKLHIEAIKSDHAGVYKCTATNSAGHVERRILITVNFRPIVRAASELVKQKVGYVKQLVCNVVGFPLPATNQISWSRENKPIVPDERLQIRNIPGAYNRITSILDIRGVKESDFGRYSCSAINSKGTHKDYLELISSQVATKDRSNRVVGSSTVHSVSIGLTVVMLLSVWLLHAAGDRR